MNEKILVNAIPNHDGYMDLVVEITMSAKIEEMLKTLKEQMSFDTIRYSLPFMEMKVPLSVKVFEAWQVKDDYLEEDYFGGQVVDQFPEVSGNEMDPHTYSSYLVIATPRKECNPAEESTVWIVVHTKQEEEDICCESPVNFLSELNWHLWYGKVKKEGANG